MPRVEVEEMGPRIDFRLGRVKEAEDAAWKEAMKKAKGSEVWILLPWTALLFTDFVGLADWCSFRPNQRRISKRTWWATRSAGSILGDRTWASYRRGR